MKNRILLYSVCALSFFGLQSCVSNYAVTTPNLPTKNINHGLDKMAVVMDKEELPDDAIIIKANDKVTLANLEKETRKNNTIDNILNEAESYIGTPYRLGGMTRSGIDCSAFVLSVFGATTDITLPRVSSAQANEGERVEKSDLNKGDLLFFQTSGRRISHVGIVHEITPTGEIKFIHASTSRGVIVSSLNEKYWGSRYKFAKRVLSETSNTL